jgi:tripeptidyl-peptidase-1
MKLLQTVVLLLAAAAGNAARTVMEPSIKNFEHKNWVKGGRVSASDSLEVMFVVKTCPMLRAAFEAKFWAVSDPKSPEYKKYLSLTEVADMLHPVPEDGEPVPADFIARYLSLRGLAEPSAVRITRTRDLVSVRLNAVAAEQLFETELYHFKPANEARGAFTVIRAGGAYSLPDELAQHVSIVDKLIRLPDLADRKMDVATPSLRRGAVDATDPFNTCTAGASKCADSTTPAVLRQRYGFPVLTSFYPGNSMACSEFQFQGVDQGDLDNFAEACGVDHVLVDTTEGAGGSAIPGVEALLDVEYIEAVAAPIPLTVINSISYSLFDWSEALNNDANPAWVQSVSYGNDEIQQTSAEYMYECNTQFMQNGLRGLSVLFASGDQGVWGRTGHTTPTGVFHPDFPAGSPYITAVGGTQFLEKSVLGEETTWADGGGGFSNTFPQPAYQAAAVEAYLNSGVDLPAASQYNATGRAYPDVSALAGTANGYCVAYKGTYGKVGGTSAACPVFAGAVAMLNDNLLSAGQPPMGFLNPWIYSIAGPAGVFNDVTTGENNEGFGSGFFATAGWDPATGFGTPNYPAMLELVMGV